jgi:hypothetical protein
MMNKIIASLVCTNVQLQQSFFYWNIASIVAFTGTMPLCDNLLEGDE